MPIVCLSPGFASASEPRATAPASQVVVPGPIERLIAMLSASYGLWKNGLYPRLDLGTTASIQQVVAQVFKMIGTDKGYVLTTARVRVPTLL